MSNTDSKWLLTFFMFLLFQDGNIDLYTIFEKDSDELLSIIKETNAEEIKKILSNCLELNKDKIDNFLKAYKETNIESVT